MTKSGADAHPHMSGEIRDQLDHLKVRLEEMRGYL